MAFKNLHFADRPFYPSRHNFVQDRAMEWYNILCTIFVVMSRLFARGNLDPLPRRKAMQGDNGNGKAKDSVQDIANYNLLLTEAIFELLANKGILTGAEVKEQIIRLKAETQPQFRWLQ
jgi:hypothetical protein